MAVLLTRSVLHSLLGDSDVAAVLIPGNCLADHGRLNTMPEFVGPRLRDGSSAYQDPL